MIPSDQAAILDFKQMKLFQQILNSLTFRKESIV